jgi:hypothetical protein
MRDYPLAEIGSVRLTPRSPFPSIVAPKDAFRLARHVVGVGCAVGNDRAMAREVGLVETLRIT